MLPARRMQTPQIRLTPPFSAAPGPSHSRGGGGRCGGFPSTAFSAYLTYLRACVCVCVRSRHTALFCNIENERRDMAGCSLFSGLGFPGALSTGALTSSLLPCPPRCQMPELLSAGPHLLSLDDAPECSFLQRKRQQASLGPCAVAGSHTGVTILCLCPSAYHLPVPCASRCEARRLRRPRGGQKGAIPEEVLPQHPLCAPPAPCKAPRDVGSLIHSCSQGSQEAPALHRCRAALQREG